MSEWKETILGDLCIDISYGYTESAKQDKVGPKFLRITDIANGRLEWSNVPYCTISEGNFEKYKLFPGDVIIARTGATTGANYTIKKNDPENVVFASYLIRYKINKELADPFYIGHLLKSPNWNDYVDAIAGGSAQPGANAKQLGSFKILLPTLTEQCAIAEILSSLDDKIDLLQRQNKTLELMAETLFRQWFVVEAREDWEEGVLNDIMEINPIYQLSKGEYAPYLEMSNISSTSFYPMNWYDRNFTSGMKFKNGDTLLARITPCLENGKACFVSFLENSQIGWGSTEYIVMRMKDPFHPFISYLFAKDADFRDFAISSMSGSSGRQRAQANVIKEYALKIPPTEVINKLNFELSGMIKKLNNNSIQIRILQKLRDTLLPKLMNGGIKVNAIH